MKDKLNIRIIVQDNGEPANEFAQRLESICDSIFEEYPNITATPSLTMTTSSDGRQTATIQFTTSTESKGVLKS